MGDAEQGIISIFVLKEMPIQVLKQQVQLQFPLPLRVVRLAALSPLIASRVCN